MKKKKIWKILLILGVAPFILTLLIAIFNSINGFEGLCFWDCTKYYGMSAFIDSISLTAFFLWPIYIICIILIIISITKLVKKTNK